MHTLKRIHLTHIFVLIILLAASVQTAQADRIYVDINATGNNDGTSWEDAYNDLHDALARAGSGDHIWVAAGTYMLGAPYLDTFEIPEGVSLYGGFAGTETSLEQRDWENNVTVLSGQNYSPWTYIVVTISGIMRATVDGFTITSGHIGISCDHTVGSGDSLFIQNNKVTWNDYGIWCRPSSPLITDCLIQANTYYGIIVSCDLIAIPPIISYPKIQYNQILSHGLGIGIHCSQDTQATIWKNQIMYNYCGISCMVSPDTEIRNNWICHNEEYGIHTSFCDLQIQQNTIADNGYAIYATEAIPELLPINIDVNSCILWDNGSVFYPPDDPDYILSATFSCIQGGWPGLGNINADPLFYPGSADYHLTFNSPCKETGDSRFSDGTDIDGQPRAFDGDCDTSPQVDMGADELFFPDCWSLTCPTQCHGDSDCDANVKGSDFLALSNSWYACYGEPNYNPCA
ncbi:MAG: right-handed parallel beta-helix repeat-containing protein, partial [Planctomycetota bacterium]